MLLPVAEALPLLSRCRALAREGSGPALWGAAAVLGLGLLARGRVQAGTSPGGSGMWRIGPLDDADRTRLAAVAALTGAGLSAAGPDGEELVRAFLDAVADALTRVPIAREAVRVPPAGEVARAPRPARGAAEAVRGPGVEVSLRLEWGGEGASRAVVQLRPVDGPAVLADAAELWPREGGDAGPFGPHALEDTRRALRRAARVWAPLGRLLEAAAPTVLELADEEAVALLGRAATRLAAAGVGVHVPKDLVRGLTATGVVEPPREGPQSAAPGLLASGGLLDFRWRVALGEEELSAEELDVLVAAHRPIIRLRDRWVLVDGELVRRLRGRTPSLTAAEALGAALTGSVEVGGERVTVSAGGVLEDLRALITEPTPGPGLASDAGPGSDAWSRPVAGPDAAPDAGPGSDAWSRPVAGPGADARPGSDAGPGSDAWSRPVAGPGTDARPGSDAAPDDGRGGRRAEPRPGPGTRTAAPQALAGTLRDYQLRGLDWLDRMTALGLGACLADDMGLGKTVTLIALHLRRQERADTAGPTLVVCPASLLGNWEREIRRFAPTAPVHRYHGAGRDLPDPAGTAPGFVLTTYGTMRRDAARLAAHPWGLLVADEAQHVKNPHAHTAKALRTIPSRGRVALTGTPVENNLTELWALLDWTTPGLLGTLPSFRGRYARAVEGDRDEQAAARLAALVRPFLLRRRKSDPGVAPELPPRTETDRPVSLTAEQVSLYEALVRESLAEIEGSQGIARRGLVMKLLTGLKQVCNHPAQYLREPPGTRLPGRSGKLRLLDELLDTVLAEDGSALVFTQYVAMGRLIEHHLAARGVPVLFLHGGTPVVRREQMVDDFQAGTKRVFLLSLKAAGTGLNLTRAGHVIHYDRWWNPAVEDQATDRAYRIGQTRHVQVHKLIAEGTVEDRVAGMLRQKRELADAVLGTGGAVPAEPSELTDGELADLVTLRRRRR